MDRNEPFRLAGQRRRVALKVSAAFLLFGLTWVLLTDLLLYRLVGSQTVVARLETAKGWTFVALTALFLYFIVRRAVAGVQSVEARGDVVLNCIADGVMLIGSQTRIVAVNPAAVRILGVASADDLVGMGPEEFSRRFRLSYLDGRVVPPDQYVSQRALRGEPVEPYRVVAHRDDGSEVVIASSAAPIELAGGQIEMSVSVMRDITRLTELDRARDQLYAAAAHSFKTPVAIIKGHAQLLRPTSPNNAYSAQVIDRQCRKIDCMIQNLIVLSRLRTGALTLHPEELDVAELAEGAVKQNGRQLASRIGFSARAHPRAFLDREKAELMIRDLLEVALARARPDSHLSLSLSEDAGFAELRVEYVPLEGASPPRPVPSEENAWVLDEVDEHTGLSVGRHVVARLVEAHGGTYGVDAGSEESESEWVRLPTAAGEKADDVLH